MNDTISRRAALDTIRGIEEVYINNLPPMIDKAEAQTRLMLLPPVQRWIPCKERLPNEDYWTGANFQYSADVLMTVYNAENGETIIDYGHTDNGSWYSETTDGLVPSWWEVLAWMPLPEPYTWET